MTELKSMEKSRVYHLLTENSGIRLDKYASEKIPELTRSKVKKLIGEGLITVNGHAAKPSLKVNAGDRIDIIIPPPSESQLTPEAMPLKILYEDKDLLVVDKPAGLTTHPAPGHPEHTLVNALLAYYPTLAEMGSLPRPGIVHRLDKDTSGLIIIAKNEASRLKLMGEFKSRAVLKIYLVLARGRVTPPAGFIEAPIGRDTRNRKKMAIVSGGREARTQYKVLKYLDGYSLLEVRTHTGRTHQIRVHLKAIGFPVAGDATYGVKVPFLSRQFLHAHKLGFKLPSTGEWVEFESELPVDLREGLKRVGSK